MKREADAGRSPVLLALGFFICTLVLALLTTRDYGLASDVGNYFEDSLRQLRWLRDLREGLVTLDPGGTLSPEAVFEHWRWWPDRIPHPPLSRELSGLGYALFGRILEPLVAYRIAVIAAYAGLVAGVALFTSWTRRSLPAGFGAGLALLTIPALFAYGHLANPDMFLAAFWFGSVAALDVHLRTEKTGWLWLSALLVGAAISTKFTGLLIGPVLFFWLLLHRAVSVRALAVLGGGALAVLLVSNPLLWVDPLTGFTDYFSAGVGRSGSPLAQITTLYFGEIFTYRGPWHYPFVWTAIVVPVPILLAAAAGAADREGRRLVFLAAVNLFVLYGVLLLPTTPLHDGVRLFLPVFPFIAILVGLGVERFTCGLHAFAAARWRSTRDFTAAVVLLAIFALPAVRTVEYHPYQLSYFNGLIGGIQGAERRGLEITSQKEVLSPAVLEDVSLRIPAGSVVNPGFFLEEMCFYQARGYVPSGWILEGELGRTRARQPHAWVCLSPESFLTVEVLRPPREPDFVFVLNRPGQHTLVEWSLTAFGGPPFYEIRLDGVPLFQIFRIAKVDES